MTNTPFSKQVQIVADYYSRYADEEWRALNDLGGPLAWAYVRGWIDEPKGEGLMWVQNSYENILDTYGIDPTADFDDLDELMDIAEYE